MTRGNKVKELMSQKDYKGWLKKDVEEEISCKKCQKLQWSSAVWAYMETKKAYIQLSCANKRNQRRRTL